LHKIGRQWLAGGLELYPRLMMRRCVSPHGLPVREACRHRPRRSAGIIQKKSVHALRGPPARPPLPVCLEILRLKKSWRGTSATKTGLERALLQCRGGRASATFFRSPFWLGIKTSTLNMIAGVLLPDEGPRCVRPSDAVRKKQKRLIRTRHK